MYRLQILTLSLVYAVASSSAWGYPTGLNVVPSAEVLAPGTASIQLELDSVGMPGDHASTVSLYTQFGVTRRLEAGLDLYGLEDSARGHWNAKFSILTAKNGLPAISAGIWNLADKSKAEPYLVTSATFGITNLHLGTLRAGGKWEALAGIGLDLGGGWSARADGRTGSDGYATFGASYTLPSGWEFTLYRLRDRNRDRREDFTGLNISWTNHLFR